jgi:hypothetical protein
MAINSDKGVEVSLQREGSEEEIMQPKSDVPDLKLDENGLPSDHKDDPLVWKDPDAFVTCYHQSHLILCLELAALVQILCAVFAMSACLCRSM